MLANKDFIDYMNCQFQLFDENNPVDSWEWLKLKAQFKAYNLSKFHLKQFKKEIYGLQSTLKYINNRIYCGEILESDRLNIQMKIEQNHDYMEFFGYESDDFHWIHNEGKMVKSFLHLEDIKINSSISKLLNGSGYIMGSDKILPTLHDFYAHLYDLADTKTEPEIEVFLLELDGLPTVSSDVESLLGPITYEEVEVAIKKLQPNKSPGLDGLTAEFYKHFAEIISPLLELVFNQIFKDKCLSFSQ